MLLIKYSEIALKKSNRVYFEKKLIENIKKSLKEYKIKVVREFGRIYIKDIEDEHKKEVINILTKISGIVEICECVKTDLDLEQIKNICIEQMKKYKDKTFKVETRRSNKNFNKKSPEISAYIGHHILKNINGIKVDVNEPDIVIYIEIRDNAYVYIDRYKGFGGLPYGSVGKTMLLLSGGIDSVVAGYMMARRGVKISATHFHSFPFTTKESIDKVKDLMKILREYTYDIDLYIVNILPIQKELRQKTNSEYFTILQRRSMTRIANIMASRVRAKSLTTGENIAQVASQTMEGINCTNNASKYPIFRPLISMDKQDIILLSKKIDSYETSILPFDDCCTVFLPPKVNTKPKLNDVLKEEEKYDYLNIEYDIIKKIEKITIKKSRD